MTRRPPRGSFGRALSSSMYCKASGKRMFLDEATALKAVERSQRDPEWENLHGHPATSVYLCPCEWWHMTSKGEA